MVHRESEIAEIREKFPLLAVERDNSGENTSKELNDFFTENGVMNYFSTPYELWQNGLAESSINSITILGRTVMADLETQCGFQLSLMNCRNAKFKKRLARPR